MCRRRIKSTEIMLFCVAIGGATLSRDVKQNAFLNGHSYYVHEF